MNPLILLFQYHLNLQRTLRRPVKDPPPYRPMATSKHHHWPTKPAFESTSKISPIQQLPNSSKSCPSHPSFKPPSQTSKNTSSLHRSPIILHQNLILTHTPIRPKQLPIQPPSSPSTTPLGPPLLPTTYHNHFHHLSTPFHLQNPTTGLLKKSAPSR